MEPLLDAADSAQQDSSHSRHPASVSILPVGGLAVFPEFGSLQMSRGLLMAGGLHGSTVLREAGARCWNEAVGGLS